MTASDNVGPWFKYGIMIFVALMMLGITLAVTYIAFYFLGTIIAGIVLIVCIFVIFAIIMRFISEGVPASTFEEKVAKDGTKKLRQVIIRDPEYGTVWFNEQGYITPTQRGVYFFYGFPNLFGVKKLIINTLTNAEMAANPIIIEGTHPESYPDEFYIETDHAIKVKGAVNNYLELKAYDSALSIMAQHGTLMREGIAGSPGLKKNVTTDISVEDLTKKGY